LFKQGDYLEEKGKPSALGSLLDCLKQFAIDAELDKKLELAERYHLERLIEGDEKLSVW
jgi:hypothetical protein